MANPENKQIPYESTQKDIRDAIESVATAIGGIAIPSADHVSYDNSGSGLSATDVQNAIDELSSEKADSSSLATVATSGDYDDLINKPTIPTVNDATLTIQKNGSDVATFTANASSNVTANITVPTTTSELTNNSDFVSDASYVHTDNNFTTAEKTKLSGIESGAEVNVQSDWNEADNTADDYIKNKPSSEVKSATDTFTTVNGGLLEECIIKLEPVQSGSGDPSPDNVRPISGHTEVDLQRDGKNLFQTTATDGSAGGITYTVNDDGSVNVSGTRTSSTAKLIGRANVKSNMGMITISGLSESVHIQCASIKLYDSTNTQVSSRTDFTTINLSNYPNVAYLTVEVKGTVNGDVASGKVTIQVEKGESPTTWTPYQGTLYQVQIGQTVYGGTVDLVSGKMTATHGYVEYDGSSDENWRMLGTTSASEYAMRADLPSRAAIYTSIPYINTNYLETIRTSATWGNYNAFISQNGSNVSERIWFTCGIKGISTSVSNWETYLASNPLQVCYKLETPITIQLTPQQIEALVGQNNLSTPLDGQSIDSVEYREIFVFDDVEKVVSLRVPISMLGTDESGRTTASQAYASGDYFYKDGYMCKALTSISAGATLTLNTNYSQGTLADILKAIENS